MMLTNFAECERYGLVDAPHIVSGVEQQTHAPPTEIAIERHVLDEAERTAVPLARAGQRVGHPDGARVEHVVSTVALLTSR